MSMAIHRASANLVPVMLNPVAKLGRVAKFGAGSSDPASTSRQTAVQATSRPQVAETPSNTAEQVHATFQYALAALGSVATTGTAGNYSSQIGQTPSGGVQQASSAAYAQVEQQAGQVLDLTA